MVGEVLPVGAPQLLARHDVAVRFGALELPALLRRGRARSSSRGHVAVGSAHVRLAGVGRAMLRVLVEQLLGGRRASASGFGAGFVGVAALSPARVEHHRGDTFAGRAQVAGLVLDDDLVGADRRCRPATAARCRRRSPATSRRRSSRRFDVTFTGWSCFSIDGTLTSSPSSSPSTARPSRCGRCVSAFITCVAERHRDAARLDADAAVRDVRPAPRVSRRRD